MSSSPWRRNRDVWTDYWDLYFSMIPLDLRDRERWGLKRSWQRVYISHREGPSAIWNGCFAERISRNKPVHLSTLSMKSYRSEFMCAIFCCGCASTSLLHAALPHENLSLRLCRKIKTEQEISWYNSNTKYFFWIRNTVVQFWREFSRKNLTGKFTFSVGWQVECSSSNISYNLVLFFSIKKSRCDTVGQQMLHQVEDARVTLTAFCQKDGDGTLFHARTEKYGLQLGAKTGQGVRWRDLYMYQLSQYQFGALQLRLQ